MKPLKRAFRFGILHAPTATVAHVATIGLARDGGLFAVPADIPESSWAHGPIDPGELGTGQSRVRVTPYRPKLHYHRSGIVRASLTGTSLDAEKSTFEPLPNRTVSTFMSITVVSPQLLTLVRPTADARKGDVNTIEGSWPATMRLCFAIIHPNERSTSLAEVDEIAPFGLVSETPSQFVVGLEGHGHELSVLGQISGSKENPPGNGPSITIAAYPEPSEDGGTPDRLHALWNADARNPILGYDDDYLWEADRYSVDYVDDYVQRFNQNPPWIYDAAGD